MPDKVKTDTLRISSIVRSHKTGLFELGLIESKELAKIIGKKIIEVKYETGE
jgi:hypothetical protein